MDKRPESAQANAKKTEWKKNVDFVFNMIGLMVGLGNVWRFPYLCYKNGGGAFLVAYWIFIILMIFPLVIVESAIGQLTGRSAIKTWNIIPLFKGIGYAFPFFMAYSNSYYPVLLAWILRWLVASFSVNVPWTKCDNEWNSNSCFPLSVNQGNLGNMTGNATSRTSSVEEFWRDHILGMTSGIEDLGSLKTDLVLCFITVWVLVYFSIWKGIGWTSKIVYVTASAPIVLLLVVFFRGVTADGAGIGIKRYLIPDISKLGEFQVWADAASQVLYSFGTCTGAIHALSGYNKFHHNFFRDSVIMIIANAISSFLAGFAIFSVLGYLAKSQGESIDEVADSGPGLVFVVYPTALSLLPLPQLWMVLFFLTLLFLGLDSMFVFFETFMACYRDVFPQLFTRKWSVEIQTAIWTSASCLSGLIMVTEGGIYVLNILNTYSISGWCLYFIAAMESTAIGWIYGPERMCHDMKRMLGYEVPRVFFKISWRFTIPVTSLVLMSYSLIQYEPLKYGRDYIYPVWADVLGWITALSSVLCVPTAAAVVLWKADGITLVEKYRSSVKGKSSTWRYNQGDDNNMLEPKSTSDEKVPLDTSSQ